MRGPALVLLMSVSMPALAFMTTTDKPDPFARKHYSAKPIVKKSNPKKAVAANDDEIAREIAEEDARMHAPVRPLARPKIEKSAASAKSAELEKPAVTRTIAVEKRELLPTDCETSARAQAAPASNAFPRVVVCKFTVQPERQRYGKGLISGRYLISDSDGFDACNDQGGEVLAGNDSDLGLMNVKDSALLRKSRK